MAGNKAETGRQWVAGQPVLGRAHRDRSSPGKSCSSHLPRRPATFQLIAGQFFYSNVDDFRPDFGTRFFPPGEKISGTISERVNAFNITAGFSIKEAIAK